MAKTTIPAGYFAAGSIATADIAANAITSAKLAQNSVLTKHIDDNQVGIDQLNVSDGSNGQVLTTNGSGTLSFSTVSGTTINSNADNRVITGSGTANTLNGESNLVYDGTNLSIGVATPNTQLHIFKANTSAHHDHIKLEMGTGWSGHQNYYKNIVWNDGTNNVGGIGMTYDGTTTNMHFHSMYNGGYKSETTNILSLLGSGKVGINDSTPTQALEVADSNNYKGIHIRGSVAPCLTFAQSSSSTPLWRVGISGYDGSAFAIATGASVGDKVHIKNTGTVLIGKTAQNQTTTTGHELTTGTTVYRADFNTSNNEFIIYNNHSSPSGTASVSFRYNNSQKGSIGLTSTGVSFNTTSDYRLKENVDYTWDATTRLKQLKPCRFNWISDETNTLEDGFLAHEVSSVVPNAVEGTKDEVYDSEHELAGEAKYQQVDNSKLVPLLVKTIQELEARIASLES